MGSRFNASVVGTVASTTLKCPRNQFVTTSSAFLWAPLVLSKNWRIAVKLSAIPLLTAAILLFAGFEKKIAVNDKAIFFFFLNFWRRSHSRGSSEPVHICDFAWLRSFCCVSLRSIGWKQKIRKSRKIWVLEILAKFANKIRNLFFKTHIFLKLLEFFLF